MHLSKHMIFSKKLIVSLLYKLEKPFLIIFKPICLYITRAKRIANLFLKFKKANPFKYAKIKYNNLYSCLLWE